MIALNLTAPGDRVRAELDQVRRKIADAQVAIEETQGAALPLQDAVERVLGEVRLRAQFDENRLTGFALPPAPLALGGSPRAPLDVLALLYNMLPDVIERGLRAHLKPVCGNGLSLAERGPRIAELRAKLAPLFEQEERLMIDLLARGYLVERSIPETGEEIGRLLSVWESATDS